MKPTTRSLIIAAAVLVAFGALTPVTEADDATDHANQLYQAQKEREEWLRQREEAQKERDDWQRQLEQAQKDRDAFYQAQKEREEWLRQREQAQKERDDWQRQIEQAQKDRDAFYQAQKERDDWQRQIEQARKERDDYLNRIIQDQKDRDDQQRLNDHLQSIQEGIDRVRQQRDDLLNRGQDAQPGAPVAGAAPQPAAPVARRMTVPPPAAPVAGPVAVPQPAPAGRPAHVLTIMNGRSVSQQWYYLDERGRVKGSEPREMATRRLDRGAEIAQARFPAQAVPQGPQPFEQTVRPNSENVGRPIEQMRQQIVQKHQLQAMGLPR